MSLTADQLEHYMYRHTAQLLYNSCPSTQMPQSNYPTYSATNALSPPPQHTHTH